VPELEKRAPYKIFLPIDADDACDYEKGNCSKFSSEQLKSMIFEEIIEIQNERNKKI
jgi:hypothetical protein